jgi:hypothetical protein
MPTSLPTNYDWSTTQAPSGPFGAESIPGSESVLGNLSGAGALGGNTNAFNLDNLTRLAGSLGGLFGGGTSGSIEDYIKEATKTLKQEQRRTTKKINRRIENIYPELTGMTGEEALNKYYDAFADTVANVATQGRADLGISPDISSEYNRLNDRVQNIQNQYSLAGRLGGYEKLALDPPVVSMNVGSIRDVADWVDPTSNQIKGKYKAMYDYQDPQTQQFIYGSRNTADAIGRYYNTSGDVSGLMNYGSLG